MCFWYDYEMCVWLCVWVCSVSNGCTYDRCDRYPLAQSHPSALSSLTPECQSKFEGRSFVPLSSDEGCIYVCDVPNLWVRIRIVTAMQHDVWEHKVYVISCFLGLQASLHQQNTEVWLNPPLWIVTYCSEESSAIVSTFINYCMAHTHLKWLHCVSLSWGFIWRT